MKNVAKWIWFAERCGVGSSNMIGIYTKFNGIRELYLADHDEYIANEISERMAESLSDKALDRAYEIIKFCESEGIGILTYSSDGYPKSLRSLKDPPAVLYYIGKLPDFNRHLCISAVGTRKMSEYGMRAAYKIAYEMAAAGTIIVSGMALGIDSVAASAAIRAGGSTIAILGCGIDVVYPREHKRLYDSIRERGALISEYPPSTEPRGYNFPIRNRLISGISQGTVVIDAPVGSGALITAKTAILQGRDIYAVPSNIDSENSSGTNGLIRDGAQAVTTGYDIIKNYAYIFSDTLDIQKLRAAEKRSEFDPSVPSSLGVRARGAAPAFGGISEKNERRASAIASNDGAGLTEYGKKAKARSGVDDTATEHAENDNSREALESLSEKQRKIFDEIPLDRAIPADYLINTGFQLGEVMSALTMLEIKGLISSLPGGLYQRK